MLVYRLYKSSYIADPLSAEGARRAGGRWNPKGYPILYTSATPELALLEVVAHLNPTFIPKFHLLVLDVPEPQRSIAISELPPTWLDEPTDGPLQTHLLDWLAQPDAVAVSVPSAIVSRSRNYLLHTLHPGFSEQVRIVENEPFQIDSRLVKNG
jgi:RES domain-containing protein